MDENKEQDVSAMDKNEENIDETSADVRGFNLRPSNTSSRAVLAAEPIPAVNFDPNASYYDMSGDKYIIILNHQVYKKTHYFKYQQPSSRKGTEKDVEKLHDVFKDLGFKVILFQDLLYDDIYRRMKDFVTQDHTNTSCVFITILTHGDKGGEIYAADQPYQLQDLTTMFEKQTSLVNKPKIFFVQACRGSKMDAGNAIQLDSIHDVLTIPTHADFLILYSTVEDYLSYRDINGSWMIQALCHIISNHHEDLDLLQMITLVHRKVAYERATYMPREKDMNNKKQMPETRFTLTKFLKF